GGGRAMRKRWGLTGGLLLLLSVCVITTLVRFFTDPVRRPPQEILADLATITPLGSRVEAVEAALREHGWHEGMCWTETKAGTKSSITARYGEVYLLGPSPGRLIVEAHWHFDDEGKLADIAL